MNKHLLSRQRVLLFAFATILFVSSSAVGAVTVTIKNNDLPGVGFNDTSPRSPVGGNSGTTLGQQRFNALQHAANIWGAVLTSNTPIVIGATWDSLPCEATGGTLASAGSNSGTRNFPGATFSNTWYPVALANALSGIDRNGTGVEILAEFNINLGTPGCLSTRTWYLGLDNNHGSTGVDLVTVALHEFAHGLGFSSFTNEATGVQPSGSPTIFDRFLLDNTTGKLWPQMTDAERQASAINFRNLVWIGSQVTANVPNVLSSGFDASSRARVFTPNPVDPGSSVSHFDTGLTPNQLMEPNISSNLTHSISAPQDLSLYLMMDIGWNTGPPPSPTPTPSPPPNDNFANAQVISGCSGSVTGTNVGATQESGEINHLLPDDGGTHSVWYRWQAPVTAEVNITTAGSNFDTVLGVYTGTAVNNLTVVKQNDDVTPTVVLTSTVTFNATAGTIYRIAVDGFDSGEGGDAGSVTLNWNQSNCTSSPPLQLILEVSGPALDQAAAFDSILWLRDPFPVINSSNLLVPVSDPNTRVAVFVANMPNVPASSVVVNLIDSNNASFNITPVAVHEFTDLQFTQVTFRLPNGLAAGTCRVKVSTQTLTSNTATFRIL
ncbi:MAG TPA: hypothetical protein VJR02_15610 [Pyrinomonadaceae bacterium]|nr:hypothetical protein [Pyrinomonadaceae bacterium]